MTTPETAQKVLQRPSSSDCEQQGVHQQTSTFKLSNSAVSRSPSPPRPSCSLSSSPSRTARAYCPTSSGSSPSTPQQSPSLSTPSTPCYYTNQTEYNFCRHFMVFHNKDLPNVGFLPRKSCLNYNLLIACGLPALSFILNINFAAFKSGFFSKIMFW